MGEVEADGPRDAFGRWRLLRQLVAACAAGVLLAPAVQAQVSGLNCFPPPIDTCGQGVVRSSTEGVAWVAWWVERDFEWHRVHGYFITEAAATPSAPGAGAQPDAAGGLSPAHLADGTLRSCHVSPHKQALAACRALIEASDRTRPPAILYNVDRALGRDGARPGYRLTAIGALQPDGYRHAAGTWCECWRGAVKRGKLQYCLVTQTGSYAACRRVQ